MTKYFVVLLSLFILIGCIEIQSSKSPIITVKRDTAIAVANTNNDLETSVYSLTGIPFPEKKTIASIKGKKRNTTRGSEIKL